ncbi:MAG: FHA domain-containing protein [Sphingobacteriales bacterium JAD_PAG50586_3]|nr:MAG: FHA domain-containing protein [Sphingobacteriales bacterium JAD_PAG50586_3]
MDNFKLCPNGHYYSESLSDCPYCPKTQNTQIPNVVNDDKTVIHSAGNENGNSDKTQIFTPPATANEGSLDKTRIVNAKQQTSINHLEPQKNARKLVGWLVSYTIDENGIDFKLFEGRNSIGADNGNDIVLPNDSSISSKHLTILFRLGTFKYKDELSTNGTFINDVIADEGNLADGDMIKLGNTIFRFRSAV